MSRPLDDAAGGAGLRSDQLHAENVAGEIGGLVGGSRQLDAACFAAPAGVDLRLTTVMCDFSRWAASRASSLVKATSPRGVVTPYLDRIAFA